LINVVVLSTSNNENFENISEGIFLCLLACLLAVFQKRIMFGGDGPAESMAGETSQQRN
jgi:hypothetical protein